jgi:hypothetical protein
VASRRLNNKRWRNKATGDTFESYEEWRLQHTGGMGKIGLLYGAEQMNGINTPPGYLWVRAIEVHPPAGEWEEV